VYQACNAYYLGLSAKRTDWKVRGQEHLHGQTIADRYRGKPDRANRVREEWGDDFYLQERPRKHRYLWLTGPKRFNRDALAALKYKIQSYPKTPQK